MGHRPDDPPSEGAQFLSAIVRPELTPDRCHSLKILDMNEPQPIDVLRHLGWPIDRVP